MSVERTAMYPVIRTLMVLASAAALGSAPATAASPTRSATSSAIAPEMRASFDEKMRLIDAIVAAVENGPDGARLTVANLVWLREALYAYPIDKLRAMGTPVTLQHASRAMASVRDAAPLLGAESSELVYYPITPCRYIDTRVVGGPLVTGSRSFNLGLTGGAYGGSLACDPKQVVGGDKDRLGALAINVTIVGPTSPIGFIGARPAGDTSTTSMVNWYEQGPGVQAANAGIVSINQQPAPTADIEFFDSPTDFIVDVFGVFAAPTATMLECQTTASAPASLNAGNRNYTVSAPACPAGHTSISVNCKVTGDLTGGNVRQAEGGLNNPGPAATCSGFYNGASTATASAERLCCRVPGR